MRTHLHTSVSFLDSRGIIHDPQVTALPLPSPQLPRNQTACYCGTPNRLFLRLFFTGEKETGPTSVSFSTAAFKRLLPCNARPGRGCRKRWQWNAFAWLLLDFPGANQAIRMQKGRGGCCKFLHFEVHFHEKLATEEKVNSKSY